jgi:hypothetical protein
MILAIRYKRKNSIVQQEKVYPRVCAVDWRENGVLFSSGIAPPPWIRQIIGF